MNMKNPSSSWFCKSLAAPHLQNPLHCCYYPFSRRHHSKLAAMLTLKSKLSCLQPCLPRSDKVVVDNVGWYRKSSYVAPNANLPLLSQCACFFVFTGLASSNVAFCLRLRRLCRATGATVGWPCRRRLTMSSSPSPLCEGLLPN